MALNWKDLIDGESEISAKPINELAKELIATQQAVEVHGEQIADFDKKKPTVVQTTGDSETAVMSQKATTEAIKKGLGDQTPHIKDGYWWIGDTNTNVKAEGKDGYTPVKGADYFTEDDKAEIVGELVDAAPVKSVNGKTGVVSLDAEDVGARPNTWTPSYSDVGADKSGAASSAVSAHNTSATAHADIREAISQLSSEKVDKDNICLGIASDGLMHIFVDGEPVGSGVARGGGDDVFGYVDENNVVVLSGNLATGAYTIKYEMTNGDLVDIGDLVLDNNVYYSVRNNLTNCTSSNGVTQIIKGNSYSATITANSGYELKSVTVTMGGSPVSVSGGVINIASVTGDIVITAVANATSIEIINQIPLSIDTDGAIYNGIGYKTNTRIKGTGAEETTSGVSSTGFIEAKKGDTVYIKGFTIEPSGYSKIHLYDSAKSPLTANAIVGTTQFTDEGNGVYSYTITESSTAFIRAASKHIMDGSEILTINQPIA